MTEITALLEEYSEEYLAPTNEEIRAITTLDAAEVARRAGCTPREAEVAALEMGIWPLRYERSRGTLGTEGQLGLLRSSAAVIGLGGLGGLAAELLARSGAGKLLVFDPDTYDDTNLNRQLHSTESNLGCGKAEETRKRLIDINGGIEVRAIPSRCDVDEVALLHDVDIVLDCLDSVGDRMTLVETCKTLNKPLVHAAIAGMAGQLAVIHPGDEILKILYGSAAEERQKGVELETGNLGPTAAALAAMQAAEAVKILSGVGTPLRGSVLFVDLYLGSAEKVDLA